MTNFTIHTVEGSPAELQATLSGTAKRFGFLPNLVAIMADSPAALQAYTTLHQILSSKTSFSPAEVQILALAISKENGCDYCLTAHSWRAGSIGLSEATITALKSGETLPDARQNALAAFVRAVVRERGWIEDKVLDSFLAAGFSRSQALDVLVAVAWKTLSNYVNHIAKTPLDDGFKTADSDR